MTFFTMLDSISSMNFALKSVPGLADVGVLHGDGDGPRTPPRGSRSKMDAYHVDQHEKLKGLNHTGRDPRSVKNPQNTLFQC